MIRFCTYFDANYLARGVTLCRSIITHLPECEVWVLCLDAATESALRTVRWPQLRTVTRAQLEAADPELAKTATSRSLIEYYFTMTPSWCHHVLERAELDDVVCYVDADVLFYRTPMAALEELAAGSVLIMPHRFPPGSTAAESRGIYNVGLIAFRNSEPARQCVESWRLQCLETCSDVPAAGKFADQKYLDDWPARFEGVVVSQRLGSCVAPWNLSQYDVDLGPGLMKVNGEPLTFFHFHGLTIFSHWLWESGLKEYGHADRRVERAIYGSYLQELRSTVQMLRESGIDIRLRDWIWRRRRRSVPAVIRKLARARVMI